VWVIKFRIDGLYMATAGKDGVLRIWKTADSTSDISKLHLEIMTL